MSRRFFERQPEVALAGVTFLWGSTFVVTKGVVRSLAPLPYLGLRFGFASLVLLALFPSALRPPRRTLGDGALLGVAQALGLLLQVLGQVYTTASKSAFVTSLATALTPLGAYLLYRERPRRRQLAGVALATAGLALLTWPPDGVAWNRGDVLTFACALVYAYVIVETARRARRCHPGELTAIQTSVAAVVFLALLGAAQLALATLDPATLFGARSGAAPALLALEARPFHIDGALGARVAYMALVCTVGTFLAQTWAMARMSAVRSAVIFALEPVFATGLAIAVEGDSEWPGPRGAFGAALILCGVIASELRRRPRPNHST
jgi:drug/metabolite transporter (DMT)-like permease